MSALSPALREACDPVFAGFPVGLATLLGASMAIAQQTCVDPRLESLSPPALVPSGMQGASTAILGDLAIVGAPGVTATTFAEGAPTAIGSDWRSPDRSLWCRTATATE